MVRRIVGVALVLVALIAPGVSMAAEDLPPIRVDVPATVYADEPATVSVSPRDEVRPFSYPLDRVVAVFAVEDLGPDLRPTGRAEGAPIGLRPTDDGSFVGDLAVPPGTYAVVPYPDVVGALPPGVAAVGPAVFQVESSTRVPAAERGGPTGWVLIAILVVAVGAPVLVTRWIRRREDELDDDHERDFRDPPTLGGVWPNGSGGGGFG